MVSRVTGLQVLIAATVCVGTARAADVAATRPATTQVVKPPQAAVQVRVAAVRALPVQNFRAGEKARRDAQRQSVNSLPDAGSFKLQDLIRFSVIDGRIRSELLAAIPGGGPRRLRIDGSESVWMVNSFSSGLQSHHTLVRYDFEAPDDQFWMVSYTFQETGAIASIYAQGGPDCEVSRLFFNQQQSSVSLNLSGIENNRLKQILLASATDLFRLRADHPEPIRKFLLPVLRKLTTQPILRPGPSDVYRVFTQIPADPRTTGRIFALLPALVSDVQEIRDRATRDLLALGPAGALAALRTDAEVLLPEQANRLGELIKTHSRMTIEDPARSAADPSFLIDCLEDDDKAVRAAAKESLEKVLARAINFDLEAPVAQREAASDRLRIQLAKEQGKDQPPATRPDDAPVIRIRG
jgi:hypothetical protein